VRLFVAVEIGAAIANRAGRIVDVLHHRAAALAPRAKGTWIPPDRMHLTIRFIGEVDDETRRAVEAALRPPIDVAPFTLSIAGIGTFPAGGSPRVIWAGVSAGRQSLEAIEHVVTTRLDRVGIPAENRTFRPHLTLARVREAGGLRSRALLDRHRDAELGTTRVDAITLFESRLSPKGPAYVPLLRTALEPDGPPARTR
jgi:2'-5' RNA ligase